MDKVNRWEDFYSDKYLNELDAAYMQGFDMAVSDVLNLFVNLVDLQERFDIEDEDLNLAHYLANPKHKKSLKCLIDTVKYWTDCTRTDNMAAMIDAMDEEEYNRIKSEVDSGARKPYLIKEGYL